VFDSTSAENGLTVLARLAGRETTKVDIVVAELQERVSPNVLLLTVALALASLGSPTRNFLESIVGVMIAATSIPPAAAVGITVALGGCTGPVIAAAVLVIVDVLSINFAALTTLWIAGYRPHGLFEMLPTRKQTYSYVTIYRVTLLAAAGVDVTLVRFQSTQLKSAARSVRSWTSSPSWNECSPN